MWDERFVNVHSILVNRAFVVLYSRVHFHPWFHLLGFFEPDKVDKSGWTKFVILSHLRNPEYCWLPPHGTIKL
jgi:hypothetical protein